MDRFENETSALKVLLVEDSEMDATLVQAHLSNSDTEFIVCHETTRAAGISRLANSSFNVIVLDLTLPDSEGIETFLSFYASANQIPIVILSGVGDDSIALEAVRRGAQDFFHKDEAISPSLGRILRYAIERYHSQKIQSEIESAEFVQQRLLPKSLQTIRGFDIVGRCDPANRVGGDYYDYFMADDHNLFVVIGDVSGHGFGPALVMAETRAALRTAAATTDDVSIIVGLANELIYDDQLNWFVTLFLIRIDTLTRQCTYAAAGHPADVLRVDGSFETLSSQQPPLGVKPVGRFDVQETSLAIGETLLLYTDGISERSTQQHEYFGPERVRRALESSGHLSASDAIAHIFEQANTFAGDKPAEDDMTAVIVKTLPTC